MVNSKINSPHVQLRESTGVTMREYYCHYYACYYVRVLTLALLPLAKAYFAVCACWTSVSFNSNLVIAYIHYPGFVDWIECAHHQHLGQLQWEWWKIAIHWDLVMAYPAIFKSHGRVCIITLPRTTKYFNCGFYYYKSTSVELFSKRQG